MGPDEPTRRLPPQEPAGQRETVRDTTYAAPDPALLHEQLLDRIRSLQTALALVGVLAAVALGVALWGLLSDDDDSGRRGAGSQRVSALEDRVAELENRIDDRATKNSVERLDSDVDQLRDDVEKATADQGDDETQQAVEDLRGDVQQLGRRVDELSQQQESQPGTATTG